MLICVNNNTLLVKNIITIDYNIREISLFGNTISIRFGDSRHIRICIG